MGDKIVSVYAMGDPRDGSVFYVGSTVKLKARVNQHYTSPFSPKAMKEKLKELQSLELRADVRVVEETNKRDRDEREAWWIDEFRSRGEPLINCRPPVAGRRKWRRIYKSQIAQQGE